MKLLDCHTHTCHSFDSEAPVEEMFRCAREQCLDVYAITDHCECNLYELEGHDKSVRESLLAARKLQQRCKEQGESIKVIAGVELGQPLQNLKAAEDVLSLGFDYVIGSLHNLKDMEDFCFLPYQEYSQQELDRLLERYFTEVLDMVRWNRFDTLAHLTYPFRYFTGMPHLKVETARFEAQVREIFRS